MIKIKTKEHPFLNSEKFNLDRIFTIKAIENGEEISEMELPIKDGEPMTIFIRANIPELEVSTDINGVLEIQVD